VWRYEKENSLKPKGELWLFILAIPYNETGRICTSYRGKKGGLTDVRF